MGKSKGAAENRTQDSGLLVQRVPTLQGQEPPV